MGTLVIGDLGDLRIGYDKGAVQNQRMHPAPIGRFRAYLEQKAERLGWKVVQVDEAWTSQDCPKGHQKNPCKDSRYRCGGCGFEAHRDVVGQRNIRSKYLGVGRRVVGAMTSPFGVRYAPHLRCRS